MAYMHRYTYTEHEICMKYMTFSKFLCCGFLQVEYLPTVWISLSMVVLNSKDQQGEQ